MNEIQIDFTLYSLKKVNKSEIKWNKLEIKVLQRVFRRRKLDPERYKKRDDEKNQNLFRMSEEFE